MRWMPDSEMDDIGIYCDVSEDKRLVMLVFNKDYITKIGALDENLLPTNFELIIPPNASDNAAKIKGSVSVIEQAIAGK